MKMIKKLTALFVLLFVCVALVGCGSVAGKTYVYDSFEYELSDDLTALEKVQLKLLQLLPRKHMNT